MSTGTCTKTGNASANHRFTNKPNQNNNENKHTQKLHSSASHIGELARAQRLQPQSGAGHRRGVPHGSACQRRADGAGERDVKRLRRRRVKHETGHQRRLVQKLIGPLPRQPLRRCVSIVSTAHSAEQAKQEREEKRTKRRAFVAVGCSVALRPLMVIDVMPMR